MVNDTRQRSEESGIARTVRDEFGEPPTPAIPRAAAARSILEAIARAELRWEQLDLSDGPVSRGALFDASGRRVPFPEGRPYDTCFVALLNPDVKARWGHPAHWAFVPADGSAPVVLHPTELPEHQHGPVRLLRWRTDQ